MEIQNQKSEIKNQKSKILFIHNHLATFVRTDLELLREQFHVTEFYQRGRAVNLVVLQRAVAKCDLVFGWFASWHTFFPILLARALHKPSMLVVGGYDSANMPEIGYGSMRGGFKAWVARTTMRSATCLLAFSESSRREAIQNVGVTPQRIETIYLGVPRAEKIDNPKENLVITVGNIDRDNMQRKGLEPFVRAAALLPDVSFVVIGAWRDDAIDLLKKIAPPNVTFTGWVENDRLQNYLARAKVYVQPSRHEGFGLAVAEAMLYQCIPVVTRVGSLPEVVGDAGIYAESAEPAHVADAIRIALTQDCALGERARERIVREFPMDARREKLFRLIGGLLADE